MRIECEIHFSEILSPFADAAVVVRGEDARRSDAAAEVIFERRLAGLSRSSGDVDPLVVVVDLPPDLLASLPADACSLRVHVDVNSTGRLDRGDYVSTQSYSLRLDALPARVSVTVEPVK
jgi:hypothetical protein